MTEYTIRAAVPDDATAIQRVSRESWHAAYDDIIGADTVDETIDEWYDIDSLRDSIVPDDHEFSVVDGAGASLVGFAHAAPLPDEPDTYLLVRIYVIPDEWGSGLGTRLLDRVEGRLRDRGIERLRLNVFADNEVGVGFYESRSFDRIEERYVDSFDATEYVYQKEL
ncbi:N-acetyltransferase family protein [Haladaptatus sp. NG-SE-30]